MTIGLLPAHLELVETRAFDALQTLVAFILLCFEGLRCWRRLFNLLCHALVKNYFLPCINDIMESPSLICGRSPIG